MSPTLGIIGGSGLYGMKDAKVDERLTIDTPFGPTSDPVEVGSLAGVPVAFLSRHGKGHRLLPAEVPYRANLWALKSLGVKAVISISAVGSLQARHAPGTLRLPDQFIDRTVGRVSTFFGDGLVAHVALADPTCSRLRAQLLAAGLAAGLPVEDGGTYVCMEGPGFSTRAESRLHQAWGADYIGMTQATEAKLAREAGLCFATVALVTDYDSWREEEPGAASPDIFATLAANLEKARELLRQAVAGLADIPPCACHGALKGALVTPAHLVPEATRRRLELLIGDYGYRI